MGMGMRSFMRFSCTRYPGWTLNMPEPRTHAGNKLRATALRFARSGCNRNLTARHPTPKTREMMCCGATAV